MENRSSFIKLNNEIINPAYIMNIFDRGYVKAYRSSIGDWVEPVLYTPIDEEIVEVRSIAVSFDDGSDYNRQYYDKEAEAIWHHFSSIATPLMRPISALDNQD